MSRALAFEGVRKRFGRRGPVVLDGLTLHVPAGGTTVLLGPSGSGKSTLLRVAAGLLEADAGRVLLGDEVQSDPRLCVPPERRRVGFVFQDLELWPHRTVAENVAFGLPGRPHGRRAAEHPRVRLLAERLGFAQHLAARPPLLSGGERQRVALARALAPEPDVVLLDEPLASLDPGRRSDLVGLLADVFREQGATALHVTHDPLEALTLGQRLAVLEAGRVVEEGSPEQLYREPRTLAGARALGAVNVLPAAREGDAWRTPLGRHPARPGDSAPAEHVVVRPEALRVRGAGARARVLGCRPDGAGWRLSLALGAHGLEALAASAAAPGSEVALEVEGPVSGVRGSLPQEDA